MERDEWLRAIWRVTLAREITPERLVFVDEMGGKRGRTRGYSHITQPSAAAKPRIQAFGSKSVASKKQAIIADILAAEIAQGC